jgi:hypothetical protein
MIAKQGLGHSLRDYNPLRHRRGGVSAFQNAELFRAEHCGKRVAEVVDSTGDFFLPLKTNDLFCGKFV